MRILNEPYCFPQPHRERECQMVGLTCYDTGAMPPNF